MRDVFFRQKESSFWIRDAPILSETANDDRKIGVCK